MEIESTWADIPTTNFDDLYHVTRTWKHDGNHSAIASLPRMNVSGIIGSMVQI